MCNIANNAHALVMQGKLEEALKLYRTYPKENAISDNETWGDAILVDINSYISKGIHKAEFVEMKKLFEERTHGSNTQKMEDVSKT